jgi:peptidoglycan glycosyltransferase
MLESRAVTICVSLGLVIGLGAAVVAWRETPLPKEPPKPALVTKPTQPAAPAAARLPSAPESTTGPDVPTSLIQPERAKLVSGGRRGTDKLVQDLGKRGSLEYGIVPDLQKTALEVLAAGEVPFGAVVAIEPSTGRILAWAQHSEEQPSLRRIPLMANPPAASVYKLVTAAALIEQAGVTPETQVCYHGGHRGLAARNLEDDPRKDKQCETFAQALGNSTNQIFGKLAIANIDQGALEKFSNQFWFNRTIPFDLPAEISSAQIPELPDLDGAAAEGGDDAAKKNKTQNLDGLSRLDRDARLNAVLPFARTAAGFENTHLSPLHGAMIAAAIANEGVMMAPLLVDRHVMPTKEVVYEAQPRPLGRVMKVETAQVLADMMLTTTTEGTAGAYFRNRDAVMDGIDISGKTGSLSSPDGNGGRFSVTWWVGFSPRENPEIAVAALVINRDAWKVKATLVAREVMEAHYRSKLAPAKGRGKTAR